MQEMQIDPLPLLPFDVVLYFKFRIDTILKLCSAVYFQ